MNKINNVLICGLGAIGGYYASIFVENNINLKVLVDKSRFERYKTTPRIINGKKYDFDYVLPDNTDYKADLIIISTKSSGLDRAISEIRNFVQEDSIIMTFLNGITAEKKIIAEYGEKVLYSYLLGHTFFRKDNEINHDGNAKIIFGSTADNDIRTELVKDVLDRIGAGYEVSDDIIKSQWEKFCFNCCVNQISALTRQTFGEIKDSENDLDLIKNICYEIEQVAIAEGIKQPDFYTSTRKSLELMISDGKTSMLQDVEAGRAPEIDLFGATVVELGEKHGINTPYNRVLTDLLSGLKL